MSTDHPTCGKTHRVGPRSDSPECGEAERIAHKVERLRQPIRVCLPLRTNRTMPDADCRNGYAILERSPAGRFALPVIHVASPTS